MTDQHKRAGTGRAGKRLAAGVTVVAMLSGAGLAGAAMRGTTTEGAGPRAAEVSCPGGMSRLGHPFNEDMTVFPFDPAIHVSDVYTVADDFFHVEAIGTGTHAGTHLDVPSHFIEGGRSIEQLAADEFVWPAYKIDVRGTTFTDNFVEVDDILAYEDQHGQIPDGALVVLQTGAEQYFGLDGPDDQRDVTAGVDKDGNPVSLAQNTDDFFDFVNPGFSAAAVQWLFDNRDIDGVGSDAYGPDAATDVNFDATYTTLLNDGVALVALANLDSLNVRSDVIIASGVALTSGSGSTTDPIACHGNPPPGHAKR